MKIILTISYILSLLFVSCCYSNEYLGNSPDYENRLVCADTSNRILSIYYPAISRVDSNINANTTRLLLPTDATTSIIVTTLKKTDTIRVSSKLSIALVESDYFCGNSYQATNNLEILRTTADSVKFNTRYYTKYGYGGSGKYTYGYTLILYQN